MKTITNFHSALYILHECHENVETIFFEFNKYPKSGFESYSNPILPSIRDYIILETASFLDEYENNFLEINNRTTTPLKRGQRPIHPIEPEYWSRIENLHKVIQPLQKILNRWTEIKKYRNNYVGHGSRATWKEGNELKISVQECYDAPRNVFEFQIMRDIIHLIFGLIAQEFKTELIDAEFIAKTLKPVINPLKDNSNIDTELSAMILEAENEAKRQGKDYSLNIPSVTYEPLQEMVSDMPEFRHPLTFMNTYRRNNNQEIITKLLKELNTPQT